MQVFKPVRVRKRCVSAALRVPICMHASSHVQHMINTTRLCQLLVRARGMRVCAVLHVSSFVCVTIAAS